MIRKKYYIAFIAILFLVNCAIPSHEQKPSSNGTSSLLVEQGTMTPTFAPSLMTATVKPLETKHLPTEKAISTDSVIPPYEISFDENSGVEISPNKIGSECIDLNKDSESDAYLSSGLVIYNSTVNEVQVRDKEGFKSISNTRDDAPGVTIRGGSWRVSPDGQWLSYFDRASTPGFKVGIINIKTGEEIQHHFEKMDRGYSPEYWGDQKHLVIPLANEANLFQWLVWNPFNQQEQIVTAKLPGMGDIFLPDADNRVYIYPVYDLAADLVIYACRDCGTNEYQAYNVQAERVQWSLDLGNSPINIAQYQPILSPNGTFMTFYFGENKIWIVSKDGESIIRVLIPNEPLQGGVVQAITWSPDEKNLAFIRDSHNPDSPYISVLSLEKKLMINLCDKDLNYGNLMWSSNSKFILHESQNDDAQKVVTIIEINSSQMNNFTVPMNLIILGWIKPQ